MRELNLIEFFGALWRRRRLISLCALAGGLLGAGVACFLPVRYTATTVMVPQTGTAGSHSDLNGLGQMVGMDLGAGASKGEVIAPSLYPRIVASMPFLKELMYIPIRFESLAEPVTLLDYYTTDKLRARSVHRPVTGATILTPAEEATRLRLRKYITLVFNKKEGYLTLSASMPDASAAAQVTAAAQELLQKYITEFKVQKTRATLDFIESRCAEARQEFEQRQSLLASFRDANRALSTETARMQGDRLENEYALALKIYQQLASEREQARIELKKTTPVLAVVEPVVVPLHRSAPRRTLICLTFTLLGAVVGGIVAARKTLRRMVLAFLKGEQ